MRSLKIIFAGTPEFSVPSLQVLLDSAHDVVAVYTQPDRPAGRGRHLTASPIKQLAEKNKLTVLQPESLRDEQVQQQLASFNADLMVVVAYGLILPEAVLKIPRLGCINVHASLLPRWRGAAPIQYAILSGDDKTGITIMQMDKGMDSGDILMQADCAIGEFDNSEDLHDGLSCLGAKLLSSAVDKLVAKKIKPKKQDETLVTYAPKINKSDAELDWQLSANELDCRVRAFNPAPVAFTHFNGELLRVWQAEVVHEAATAKPGVLVNLNKDSMDVATGDGVLRLQQVQLPGKRALNAQDFINAHREQLIAGKTILS